MTGFGPGAVVPVVPYGLPHSSGHQDFIDVPQDVKGSVIGKQGKTIKGIMWQTGAKLFFPDNGNTLTMRGSYTREKPDSGGPRVGPGFPGQHHGD
mmetsp:Transcript_38479/g.92462  ORF Transcript_38479/g.92462 Transcript_38479/m.92462 type:complete len:95 (-) Transcript_38479:211-495(-)